MPTFNKNQMLAHWQATRQGNRRAFEQFYLQSVAALYGYGCQLHPDVGLVEDSVQDLFAGLWKNRASIEFRHSVKHYLFLSLRRLIFQKANKKNGIPMENGDLETYLASLPAANENDQTLAHQRRSTVAAAIHQLPRRQREAIFLKYYECLNYEEIATLMSLQKQGVYKLVSVGIKRLRGMLVLPA